MSWARMSFSFKTNVIYIATQCVSPVNELICPSVWWCEVSGEMIEPCMVAQAQLVSRYWRGCRGMEDGREIETWKNDGEAVVSAFPIVKPGHRFNYSSRGPGMFGDKLSCWFYFCSQNNGEIKCSTNITISLLGMVL
jgi:uncharacterized protein affecting Mg2+/Co2+ transport